MALEYGALWALLTLQLPHRSFHIAKDMRIPQLGGDSALASQLKFGINQAGETVACQTKLI